MFIAFSPAHFLKIPIHPTTHRDEAKRDDVPIIWKFCLSYGEMMASKAKKKHIYVPLKAYGCVCVCLRV